MPEKKGRRYAAAKRHRPTAESGEEPLTLLPSLPWGGAQRFRPKRYRRTRRDTMVPPEGLRVRAGFSGGFTERERGGQEQDE